MKKIKLIAMILCIVLIIAGCGGTTQPTQSAQTANKESGNQQNTSSVESSTEQYVFNLGHVNTPDHPYQLGAEKFKEIVEERSEGQLKIEIFPSGQLGNARDQIEALQLGSLQLYVGSVAPAASFAPKLNALSLPYLFRDKEHALKVLDGEIGEELAAELIDKGIINLAFWENGWRHMTNNVRPIKSAEDVQGLKIRVQEAPVYISFMNALGATPTPMSLGELYTSLAQKVVDGQENPLAQITQNKFYEVQQFLSLTAHTYDAAVFMVSKEAFDNLPVNLQEIVMEAAKEAAQYQRNLNEELTKGFMETLKSEGMEIEENPDLESFRKAVEPVYQEHEDAIGRELINKIRNLE